MPDVTPILTPVYELHLPKECEAALKKSELKDLPEIYKQPTTQFSITLVRDSELNAAWSEIRVQPVSLLVAYAALWVLLIWILRAWRLQKAPTMLLKIWAQAWISVIGLLGLVILVPALAWGDPYRMLLSHLIKAVFRHFLS